MLCWPHVMSMRRITRRPQLRLCSATSVSHTLLFRKYVRSYTKGGHSYAYRRTVYDRGQDAVKWSSTLFALGKTVKA